MGLLNRQERALVIELLLKLPGKEKFSVRTNLIAFVSPDVKNSIERDGAPRQDFQNILSRVDDEEWDESPPGGWPLLTLLANAREQAGASSRLGSQIQDMYVTALQRAAAWAKLPRTTAPEQPGELERLIQQIGGFLDSVSLRRSEQAVCRLEFEGANPQAQGTGFLLAPGLVMTNFHVMQDVIKGLVTSKLVILRFDYIGSDTEPAAGQEYRLAEDWLVDKSPINVLDYTLLRVAGDPGSAPASDNPNGPPRGYLVPAPHTFRVGEPLVIIQHPQGRPRRFSVDRVKYVPEDGMRIAYLADTDYGSSGSPCLTASFELCGAAPRILWSTRGPYAAESRHPI